MAIARLLSLELARQEIKIDIREYKDLQVPRLIFHPESRSLSYEDGSGSFRLGPCISSGAFGKVYMVFEGDISKERKLSPYVFKYEMSTYIHRDTHKKISERAYKLLDPQECQNYELRYLDGKRLKSEALVTSKFLGNTAFYGDEEKTDEPHGILMLKKHGDTLYRFNFCTSLQYLSILIKLITQVKELHKQGLAHTDLHANNVLVTPQGDVNIIDYGNVLIMGKKLKKKHFKKERYPHLAPEQLEGDILVSSDLDVYSLGNILESTYKHYNFNLALKSKFLKLIAKTKDIPYKRIDVDQLRSELTSIYFAELLIKNQHKLIQKHITRKVKVCFDRIRLYIDDTESFLELYNKIDPKNKFAFVTLFGAQRIYAITKNLKVLDKHKFLTVIMAPFGWFEQYKFKKVFEMEVTKNEKKPSFFNKNYEISEQYEDRQPTPRPLFPENRT